MAMATDTLCDPKTLPTTVGMVEKKPPFAAPLRTTKTVRGARVVDAGHSANIVTALINREQNRTLSAPNLSQKKPQRILPAADDRLKPARRPAPVEEDSPTDLLYRGIKKGGTRRGNVAIAPAAKMMTNPRSRKRRLETG
jgi:hypothetical protein